MKQDRKKAGRPIEKQNGIHHTCMSFDREVFDKFKELSNDLNKKSITAFLEEMMLEQLKRNEEKQSTEESKQEQDID